MDIPPYMCNVSACVNLSVAERIEGLMNQHVSFYMVDFLLGNLDLQMSAQKRDHDPFCTCKKTCADMRGSKGMQVHDDI